MLWHNLLSGFSVQQKLWQKDIMWKGEQRKVHFYQMFTKFISLVQVSLSNTNSLKHKIPNTSPLKPIYWINTIPWQESMICYSWSYQSYISHCASVIKSRQVFFSEFMPFTCSPQFFTISRSPKNNELLKTVCKLNIYLFTMGYKLYLTSCCTGISSNYFCYICQASCNVTEE